MEEVVLKDIFHTLWSKRIHILLIVFLFFVLGVGYTVKLTTPIYRSSVMVVLVSASKPQEGTNTQITAADISINTKLLTTYSKLAQSKIVLDQTIQNLKLPLTREELQKNVSVKAVQNAELLEVSVQHENPQEAARIANELVRVFAKQVKELYNISNIQVMDEASIPEKPDNINHTKDVVIFVGIGFLVACAYVFFANIFDQTVKSAEGIESEFGVPVLVSIPNCEMKKEARELFVQQDPKSPISELFRSLRTNLQFRNNQENMQTILVTSTMPQEGKSFISANLAITFAQTGKKVILIDADMRRGRQDHIFDRLPKPGLSNALVDYQEELILDQYIQETEVENLSLMTAGDIPPNPSELLVSEATRNVIQKLKSAYDMIIVDGPPTELVTDSLILTTMMDSTVIVTLCKGTKRENLKKMMDGIQKVGGKIAGTVLNKVEMQAKQYREHYYYGSK